jgi:hypothetical protein
MRLRCSSGWHAPEFAGSNPVEDVGFFFGRKNPQHAFLRKGSKAVGPAVADLRHVKEPLRLHGSWVQGEICRPFLGRDFLLR